MMKKAVLLLLVLVLSTMLSACGEKTKTEQPVKENPIIGTWEVKTADREQSFTFTGAGTGTEGSYKYYDYADGSWGEFTFTVKEQTDSTLTLLIDDGTMDEMYYKVLGDRLYLEGVVYTNNTVGIPTLESITSFAMIYEGADYRIYEDLFMGMYVEDVEHELDEPFSLETAGYGEDYEYNFTCDYEADIDVKDGVYYNLRFGFDDSKRLVHLTKQGHYEADSFQALTGDLTAKFGEPDHSQRTYTPEYNDARSKVIDTFTWTFGDYIIKVETGTEEGESAPSFYTECYYYKPN